MIADVAIPSTVGLLRRARRKVLKAIGKKYPKRAAALKGSYGVRDPKGRRATEEELMKEVALTRELFSSAKGKYTKKVDKIIEGLQKMLYGQEKIASLSDADARFGHKDEDHPFCGYKVHIACDESELVTSLEVFPGNENEGAEKHVRSLLEKEDGSGIRSQAVVADALYDSAENRKAIHEKQLSLFGGHKFIRGT